MTDHRSLPAIVTAAVAPAPNSYFSPISPDHRIIPILLPNQTPLQPSPPPPPTAPETVPVPPVAQHDESATPSRATSPHCHFAPLPKLQPAERSLSSSRRNSVSVAAAQRSKILSDHSTTEQFPLDLDETSLPTLTTASGTSALAHTLSSPALYAPRPITPRSSSAGREPTISPGISRPPSAQSSAPLSRKPSMDHISHHYIEAKSRSSSISRSGSVSRDRVASGGAEKEKEVLGFDVLRAREAAAWRDEKNASHGTGMRIVHPTAVVGNPTTLQPLVSAPSSSSLVSPLLSPLGGLTLAPSPSPTIGTRRTFFVDPVPTERERAQVAGRCRPVEMVRRRSGGAGGNEEVVQVAPPEEPVELDPMEEEEEEDEEEEDQDDEEDEEGEEEDDDNGLDKPEEEDEEEVEDHDEVERKTARGAGVEVVHWHRHEDVEV